MEDQIHAREVRDLMKEPILEMGNDKVISRRVYNKPFTVRFPAGSEWKGGSIPIRNGDWGV
jgi:hypothetical protein